MRNFWLEKYRVGRRIQYIGPVQEFSGRIGRITKIQGQWIEVEFIFIGFIPQAKVLRTEKRFIKIL